MTLTLVSRAVVWVFQVRVTVVLLIDLVEDFQGLPLITPYAAIVKCIAGCKENE